MNLRGVGDAPTAFEGLGILLGLSVVVMGAAVAYGVFVEAPRERKYAKRRDQGRRRAYEGKLRANGRRSAVDEARAIEAEEDRNGATALQKRFNAGEFDDDAKAFREVENELTRLYDSARENVIARSAKKAKAFAWEEKGGWSFLKGKDGSILATVSYEHGQKKPWRVNVEQYTPRGAQSYKIGSFSAEKSAKRAAEDAGAVEARRRASDPSLVESRYAREASSGPSLSLGLRLEQQMVRKERR